MAKTRIGINGFGRIGRAFLRLLEEEKNKNLEVVAVNSGSGAETIAHLLKYDSVYGKFKGDVKAGTGSITVNGRKIAVTTIRNPAEIPWKKLGVDLVLESTGAFKTSEKCSAHLKAGAQRVLISAPPKDETKQIVFGVNEQELSPNDKIISAASCTTSCLAPTAKVLHENFGIKNSLLTTIHAVTMSQRILDGSHKDLRRARACFGNLIPTTTGAAKAITKIMPELKGKIDAIAIRVPLQVGSVIDMAFESEKEVSAEKINSAFKKASEGKMKGIIQYSTEPIVSSDVLGTSYSAVFDPEFTKVQNPHFGKIFVWYDNEMGYTHRLVDLAEYWQKLK